MGGAVEWSHGPRAFIAQHHELVVASLVRGKCRHSTPHLVTVKVCVADISHYTVCRLDPW